jgi:ubiquinone/menaquinone biosynthesis C-methylase UbiE
MAGGKTGRRRVTLDATMSTMTSTGPNVYDEMAAAYAESNTTNAYNGYYERPASLALLGDVAGQRVLDAGCGPGQHAVELVARGATVTGLDSSAGLLAEARKVLGQDADLHVADLAEPLPLPDNTFDAVLGSLVMHYIEDWVPTLREFHRVLVPGGRFVMSTHHPAMDHAMSGRDNYFETYEWSEVWQRGGRDVTMRFWHRPLHAMTDALTAGGFQLDVLSEPQPVPAARDLFPGDWVTLTTEPRFLFLAAHAV